MSKLFYELQELFNVLWVNMGRKMEHFQHFVQVIVHYFPQSKVIIENV